MTSWLAPDRHARQAVAGLGIALTPVSRAGPLLAAWRWRYEIALAAGLPAGLVLTSQAIGLGRALAGLGILLAVFTCWPPARRALAARAWCVITPHRVRTGCAQAWIQSRAGKIPAVLMTNRMPYGERVQLWCHAGTDAADLAAASEALASACWAAEILVTRHPRFAHLVVLDVIRHPLLPPPAEPGEEDYAAVADLPDPDIPLDDRMEPGPAGAEATGADPAAVPLS